MSKMRLISVMLPERDIEDLDWLVGKYVQRYNSRSEAIRSAIQELLRRELAPSLPKPSQTP